VFQHNLWNGGKRTDAQIYGTAVRDKEACNWITRKTGLQPHQHRTYQYHLRAQNEVEPRALCLQPATLVALTLTQQNPGSKSSTVPAASNPRRTNPNTAETRIQIEHCACCQQPSSH
jgi:hypothetical protein